MCPNPATRKKQIMCTTQKAFRQQICVMLTQSQPKKNNKKFFKAWKYFMINVTDEDNILISYNDSHTWGAKEMAKRPI